MSDSEQIAQFVELTGASVPEAQQFLQGSDLQTAIATYFAAQDAEDAGQHGDEEEDDDDDIQMMDGPPAPAPAPAARGGGAYTLSGAPIPVDDPISRTSSAGGSSSGARIGRVGDPSTAGRNPTASSGGRIGTLSSLNASAADDSDDSGDDSKKPEFYAGGGKSGLAIQNPDDPRSGGGPGGEDLVKEILARARDGGTGTPEESTAAAAAGRGARPSVFSGTGMTLGSDQVPSVAVPDPSHVAPQPGRSGGGGMNGLLAQMFGGAGGAGRAGGLPQPRAGGMMGATPNDQEEDDDDDDEPQIRHLTFWKDGFSVEDGPLMKYDDPVNKEILAAIKAGRAPLSILNVKFGQRVELHVAQRQTEAYQPPPKQPAKPFSGAGNRLGSPAPEFVSAPPPAPAPVAPPPPSAGTRLHLDESKPTTNVQIRLADGTKLPAKLNLDHTVGDIRRLISAAQPGSRAYVIQTTFPNKTLDDDSLTIEQAGLKNAVVVQRWT